MNCNVISILGKSAELLTHCWLTYGLGIGSQLCGVVWGVNVVR